MDVIELRLFTWLARVGSGDLAKLHALLCAHRVSKNCPIYFLLRSFFFFFYFSFIPLDSPHACVLCVCAWRENTHMRMDAMHMPLFSPFFHFNT